MEYKKLKNGAQIIIAQNKNLKTISVSVNLNVGTKNENNNIYGISHFIEHLICQDKKLNKDLDLSGATIYGTTYKERTEYFLRILEEDFVFAFNILIKTLLEFKIKQHEIRKERKIIIEEIFSRQNDNSIVVEELLESLMYPNSYAGKSPLGSIDSVKKLTRKDIKKYYKKYYNPNNLVVCLVGNITPSIKKRVVKIIQNQRAKNNLDLTYKIDEPDKSDKSKKHLIVKKERTRQIEAAIGFKGFNLFDDRKYILELLSIVLTDGYNARIFKELREKKGLVYCLESFCVEYIENGYLEIKFKCAKNNLQKILKIIKKEIETLSSQLINNKELMRAKKIFKNQINSNMENPGILSEELAAERILTKKNISIEKKLFSIVDNIKKKDILKIASQVFAKKNTCISLIGNISIKEKSLF